MSARQAAAQGDQQVSACKGANCRSRVRWVKTTAGHWVPVELDRDPQGSLTAVHYARKEWRVRAVRADEQLPQGAPRYTPHWEVCPDAEVWRKDRMKVLPDAARATAAAGPGPKIPCAGCGYPEFWRTTGTLCEPCQKVLADWRAMPNARRPQHIPYLRWDPAQGRRVPTRRHLRTAQPDRQVL